MSFLYITWFIITRFFYSFMSFLYVTWLRNSLKLHSATSKMTIGGNTLKNDMVAYLHMTWPNHAKLIKPNYAKLIKAAAPKIALMKGTHLTRPRDFWLHDTLANEKNMSNFYKGCQTSNLIEKNTESNTFIL